MSNVSLRHGKSRSMMISLYVLSALASIAVFALTFSFLFQSLLQISAEWNTELIGLFPRVLLDTLIAGLISLPFVVSLTFVTLSRWSHPYMARVRDLMKFTSHSPDLIMGVLFLLLLGPNRLALIATLSLLFVHRLTRRWIDVSLATEFIEVDCVLSLGGRFKDVLWRLYLKRYFKQYLLHFVAVMCSMLLLVTPIICLQFFGDQQVLSLSLQLYNHLGDNQAAAGLLALLLFGLHGLRFFLDLRTQYQGVEYG